MAFDDPPTARAFRAYRSRAWMFTLLGLAGMVVATVAVGMSETTNGLQNAIGLYGFGGGPVLLGIGVAGLVRSVRIRRLLRSRRWESHAVRSGMSAWGHGILLDGEEPYGGVYLLSGTKQRVQRFTRGEHTAVLFAGLPDPWVVAAPPDRAMLIVARRPRLSSTRRHARTAAMRPPLTPESQAQVKKDLRVYLLALLPVSVAIPLVMALVNLWLGLGLMACGLLAMAITFRRWANFPRKDPPPNS